MRSARRRAYVLCELLGLVPAFVIVLLLTTRLANRATLLHRATAESDRDRTSMTQVVDTIRQDALRARSAQTGSDEARSALSLETDNGVVAYAFSGEKISRTEDIEGASPLIREWPVHDLDLSFHIETIRGQGQVVWIRIGLRCAAIPGEQAYCAQRNMAKRPTALSAAFAVGRGELP